MPSSDARQTMMFSATFPANIQRLASDFMRDYVYLTVGRVGSASKDVTQSVDYVEENDKMEALMKFLLTIEDGLILIFVETKRACDYVEHVLCSKGFPACSIHGDKSQREREDALRAFKRGETPVMVATDGELLVFLVVSCISSHLVCRSNSLAVAILTLKWLRVALIFRM
jgi:ATP-dependent RNA helicase DDX3X